MARNRAPDEITDPTKLLDTANAHPSPGPAEQILDEGALTRFRDLFNALVQSTRRAAQDPEGDHNLAGAVDDLRAFLIGYNQEGDNIGTDLAFQFVRATHVNLEELAGMEAELLLGAFRQAASAEGVNLAAPIVQSVNDEPEQKKRSKIMPGYYKGRLTHEMIIESARLTQNADPLKRRPANSNADLIIHGPLAYTGLTWRAVNASLYAGCHDLPGGERLAPILIRAGLPKQGISVTHAMIIESARAEQNAHPLKRRPKGYNTTPIIHGPLASTGLTWKQVHAALCEGLYGLPGEEELSKVLTKAGLLKQRTNITHAMILASARAEQSAHPLNRRPTSDDSVPIIHGPFAYTGWTWKAVNRALRLGLYGLPGEENLSPLLDEAGLPNGTTLTHARIVESARAEQDAHPLRRRPTNSDTSLITHGSLAGTRLTWKAVGQALRQGCHHLPGEESLSSLLDEAGLPSGITLTHAVIIESARAEQDAHPLRRRPSPRDTGAVKHGSLADTGFTWRRVNAALCKGFYHLPGGETLAEILNAAGLPAIYTRRSKNAGVSVYGSEMSPT